jgi:hypothetical protein
MLSTSSWMLAHLPLADNCLEAARPPEVTECAILALAGLAAPFASAQDAQFDTVSWAMPTLGN